MYVTVIASLPCMHGNAEVTAAVHGCDGNFNLSVATYRLPGKLCKEYDSV